VRDAAVAIQVKRLRRWILPRGLEPFSLLFSGLRPVLPRGVRAYRARGGVLYFDVSESPTMLARAVGLSRLIAPRVDWRTTADVVGGNGRIVATAAGE